MRSTSCRPARLVSMLTPRMIPLKNGSPKTRVAGSEANRAMASERLVISARAAWLGTYPSSSIACWTRSRNCSATVAWPLTTRETVARDTPARAATSSRFGRAGAE